MVTQYFLPLAETSRKAKGMPDLPMVVVPHPFDTLPEAEILRITDEVFDQIVAAIKAG